MQDLVLEAMQDVAEPTTNLTSKHRKLAAFVAVMRETWYFRNGLLDYSLESDPYGNTSLRVWSIDSLNDIAFNVPELSIVAKLLGMGSYVLNTNGRITLIIT